MAEAWQPHRKGHRCGEMPQVEKREAALDKFSLRKLKGMAQTRDPVSTQ